MPSLWMACGNASQRENVQPPLAGAHGCLRIYVLWVINDAMREHRPDRDLVTIDSLQRMIKQWNTMPALFHLPGGRNKR